MRTMTLLARFTRFRAELGLLWRAFRDPATPMWLKLAMLAVPGYLLMPLDIIPDFVPLAGWLDDLIVVPLIVSWIVGRLPQKAEARSYRSTAERGTSSGPRVIDGTWRRR